MKETWLDRLLERFRLVRLRKHVAYIVFYPGGKMQGHLPHVKEDEVIPTDSPMFWASTCMLITSGKMQDLVDEVWDRAMQEPKE